MAQDVARALNECVESIVKGSALKSGVVGFRHRRRLQQKLTKTYCQGGTERWSGNLLGVAFGLVVAVLLVGAVPASALTINQGETVFFEFASLPDLVVFDPLTRVQH